MKCQVCVVSTSKIEVINTVVIWAITLLRQYVMKQVCLVLLRVDPSPHKPLSRMYSQLEEVPVWNLCSFQFNRVCFKSNKVGLMLAPRLWPCTARMWTIVPFWFSQYSTVGLSIERLSASIQSSVFHFCVSPTCSMRVETCVHLSAPSDSWQPSCRRIFVKVLEMPKNSTYLLCFASCWDYFPISWTESNWCKLWLWRSFKSCWRLSTCCLCSRPPATTAVTTTRLQNPGGQTL